MTVSAKEKFSQVVMTALVSVAITGAGMFLIMGANNADKAFVEKEVGRLEQVVESNNEVIMKLNEMIARHDERIKHLEQD